MNAPQQDRSQRRNARRAYAGVSSRSVTDGEQAAPTEDALLQRTIGNTRLAQTHPRKGDEWHPEALSARNQVATNLQVNGIVARALQTPTPVQRVLPVGGATPIQRLISAGDFAKQTKRKTPSKSDAFFADLTNEIRTLEALPLTKAQPTSDLPTKQKAYAEWLDRKKQMRVIYSKGNEWRITAASKSPRKQHVDSLLLELKEEMKQSYLEQPPDLANTAQGTATTPVATTKRAHRTPEQKQAFAVIKSSNLVAARRKHAYQMIRDPEMIQQGAFGVCGLTSILYAVAKSSPKRFAEMIRDAWADTALVKQWLEVFYNNSDGEHISQRAEVEYVTSQWLVRKGVSGQQESRTLRQQGQGNNKQEVETTKKKDYALVFEKQRKFSDEFEIQGWENTKGHFALTASALSMLLNGLGTGKPSVKIKKTTFAQDYARASQLAGKGSVLASVVDTTFYKQGGKAVDVMFNKTRKPKYVHWVTLKDVTEEGIYYKMKIWTWRENFEAKVRKDVVDSYIHSLVVAEVE